MTNPRKIPIIKYEQLPYKEFDNGFDYRYAIKLGEFYNLDQAGYRTIGKVYIHDKKTNIVYVRRGRGRQIGNFHPIWIEFFGKEIQIESLSWLLMED